MFSNKSLVIATSLLATSLLANCGKKSAKNSEPPAAGQNGDAKVLKEFGDVKASLPNEILASLMERGESKPHISAALASKTDLSSESKTFKADYEGKAIDVIFAQLAPDKYTLVVKVSVDNFIIYTSEVELEVTANAVTKVDIQLTEVKGSDDFIEEDPTPRPIPPVKVTPSQPTPDPQPTKRAALGFFFVDSIGYFENDQLHHCAFANFQDWLSANGPENPASAPTLAKVPEDSVSDGKCPGAAIPPPAPRAPMGFFFVGSSGYFENDQLHHCAFASFQDWLAANGPANTSAVSVLSEMPGDSISDGKCPSPALPRAALGFFFVGSTGYFENDKLQRCEFKSFQQWVASGGPESTSAAPTLPEMPGDSVDVGECPVRGHFAVGSDRYYSGASGHYCHFVDMQSVGNAGGSTDPSSIPNLSVVPSNLQFDGDCPY